MSRSYRKVELVDNLLLYWEIDLDGLRVCTFLFLEFSCLCRCLPMQLYVLNSWVQPDRVRKESGSLRVK